MEILATSLPELPKPSKTFKNLRKTKLVRDDIFRETDVFAFMDWTISDGSGGESYTVGRAESESEVEIVENLGKTNIFRDGFEKPIFFMDWTISNGSGGESHTVGRAESESEVEIAGKP